MSIFTGSCVAMVTPFTNTGINYDSLKNSIDFQINEGTDALLACGTTGEPSTMTEDEKLSVIRFTIENTNKRIPVLAGTGGNNTAKVIKESIKAEEFGADGLVIVTPYYNKTTQKGLIAHYKAVSDAVTIPIIVYNVPSRTGLNILPETLFELSKLKNVVGMKEASSNISQVVEMARLCRDSIDLYSGNDDMVIPLMSVGGKGVISVIANITPKDTHNMAKAYLDGDFNTAVDLQFKLNPLVKELFSEVNPIPVKTAMNILGMNAGPLRLPLTEMSQDNKQKLTLALEKYGLLK